MLTGSYCGALRNNQNDIEPVNVENVESERRLIVIAACKT